jgi:hypothetical protein
MIPNSPFPGSDVSRGGREHQLWGYTAYPYRSVYCGTMDPWGYAKLEPFIDHFGQAIVVAPEHPGPHRCFGILNSH